MTHWDAASFLLGACFSGPTLLLVGVGVGSTFTARLLRGQSPVPALTLPFVKRKEDKEPEEPKLPYPDQQP